MVRTNDRHLMADIESLSIEVNAVVLSIGAVVIDPRTGERSDEFYTNLQIKDQMNTRHIDPNTLTWWFKQSSEARQAAFSEGVSVTTGLINFRNFCTLNGEKDSTQVYIWGNGNTFDNMILRSLFKEYGVEYPAHYRNDLDLRTFIFLGKQMTDINLKLENKGVRHNALDDAIYQADLMKMYINEAFKNGVWDDR